MEEINNDNFYKITNNHPYVFLDSSILLRNHNYKNEHLEEVLTPSFFKKHPTKFHEIVNNFYISQKKENKVYADSLNKLIKSGKISKVITLNPFLEIDNEMAKHYIFLFGEYNKFVCQKCGNKVEGTAEINICPCGEILKPDIVLFGEQISLKTYNSAFLCIAYSNTIVLDNFFAILNPAKQLLNSISTESLSICIGKPDELEYEYTYFINTSVNDFLYSS